MTEKLHRFHLPAGSYIRTKEGEEVHFIKCKEWSDDNYIELNDGQFKQLIAQLKEKENEQ